MIRTGVLGADAQHQIKRGDTRVIAVSRVDCRCLVHLQKHARLIGSFFDSRKKKAKKKIKRI
jgi:hypothetical protein